MKIAIIGLGYVGLPLAIALGEHYEVIGFDINSKRVQELQNGFDRTGEATKEQIQSSKGLQFSDTLATIASCTFYIVTVPTPIDQFKAPDLQPLLKASAMLGKLLKKGDIVVYESTVYPGCTEEDCVPVLEAHSGLQFNTDFFCGYSPERINPGDKINTLATIKKVTSGSTPEIAQQINEVYARIITAGTFMASSIRVAEASKAIENAQRDVNISFVNELALIFDRMGIDTQEVLAAASTKWNFLPYKPGLVGGHCIGVDPYYLAHKAQALGYHPQVILSGRRVNDTMGLFIANKTVKLMIQKGITVKGAKALVLGITFKENCPDIRNTRVVDIIDELQQFGMQVDVYDPHANADEVAEEYGITLCSTIGSNYSAIIVCVAHQEFKTLDYKNSIASPAVIFDTKAIWDKDAVDARL
ncbi:MAG: nucleotide sugar dehydrogenase [Chitinophagia bacterium]|nr:nucleotide sugar dehydrogenase [Chitinophagia bacterium]